MVLLNNVVEVFVGPHFDISPARTLTSQQPKRTMTRPSSVTLRISLNEWWAVQGLNL